MCYALGLIDTALYDTLSALLEIRNPLAHPTEPHDITNADVRRLLGAQSEKEVPALLKKFEIQLLDYYLDENLPMDFPDAEVKHFSEARRRFMHITLGIYIYIARSKHFLTMDPPSN